MVKSILKSILVGIDRSSDNTPAMELGLHWARQFEAQLVSIGLVDESEVEAMEPIREGYIEHDKPSLLDRIRKEFEQVLEAYSALRRGRSPL